MAWTLPEIYSYTSRDFEGDTREALDTATADAPGPEPRVPVRAQVVAERPAGELIDASRAADLPVVGSHGRSGFTGMLLGSTSQRCAGHAKCSVVVVR